MAAVLSKRQMTEEDIKLQLITPAITKKWALSLITMETRITDGQINLRGNMVSRKEAKKADYILYLNESTPIAIVEAKDNKHAVGDGLQQAMQYAIMMDIPFACTCGHHQQDAILTSGNRIKSPIDSVTLIIARGICILP